MEENKRVTLASAKVARPRTGTSALFNTSPTVGGGILGSDSVWSSSLVDKMNILDLDTFEEVIKNCRFYWKHEPIANTVVEKIIDLAINDLIVVPDQKSSQTEQAIFESISRDIIPFLRDSAREFLLTGLVVPEIKLTRLNKNQIRRKKIPRLSSLYYPTSMWVRDSSSIEIKKPLITEKESYYLLIPEETIYFIQNQGEYPDGSKDIELYREIVKLYPEFVSAINNGALKVKLDNPLILKASTLSNSPYPVPYLYSAVESMKHKRNLKKMDYSIAARVISAILHVRVGDKDFPLTKDQEDQLDDLEAKFKWRDGLSTDSLEKVIALFTNHTVEIEWIFPNVNVLLDEKKYSSVNKDILISLGFPRILITGETEKSFTSDPQIATLSPLETMNRLRDTLMPIIDTIYLEMESNNRNINTIPEVKFAPINLLSLDVFYKGLVDLYATGNLSRESYARAFGYDLKTELKNRSEEKQLFEELEIQEFAPVPHSNTPQQGGGNTSQNVEDDNNG